MKWVFLVSAVTVVFFLLSYYFKDTNKEKKSSKKSVSTAKKVAEVKDDVAQNSDDSDFDESAASPEPGFRRKLVIGNHLHPETAADIDEDTADLPGPDDADGLAVQVEAG